MDAIKYFVESLQIWQELIEEQKIRSYSSGLFCTCNGHVAPTLTVDY
jgi:hypothetical protein